MPATVNGIGTHYYFKRNLRREYGVCEHCHREGLLESYETWLCFCVIFIPLIPLGKKQILNSCPSCTWHRVMPFTAWEKLRVESIRGGMEEVAKAPNDPKAAIRMHATLDTFGRNEEADKLLAIILARFPRDYDAQMYAGAVLDRKKKPDDADACFRMALSLSPEDRPARRAVGVGMIRRGELEKAAEMLSFMNTPSPDSDAAVLFLLASSFQKAGRHDRALDFFKSVLAVCPGVTKERKFRKAVSLTEKALGKRESILPGWRVPWKGIWIATGGAAAAFAVVIGANVYIAGHRTLHVINALPVSAEVSIAEAQTARVQPSSRIAMTVPESSSSARILYANGRTDTVALNVRSGWWARFFENPVFILNLGGGAVVAWEQTVYTVNQPPGKHQHMPYRFHIGQTFLSFPRIDYPFQDFPRQISVDSHATRITKTRIDWANYAPVDIIGSLLDSHDKAELMSLAEAHLRFAPADSPLLHLYITVAVLAGQESRARDYLRSGLDHKPVQVNWHRMYQTLVDRVGGSVNLLDEYDRFLAADPTNAALHYLRGRCAPGAESIAHFDRAIALDPNLAFAYSARAFSLANRGDIEAAIADSEKAVSLDTKEDAFEDLWVDLQLAAGHPERIETRMRRQLAAEPMDMRRAGHLLRALWARGDESGAAKVEADVIALVARQAPADPRQIVLGFRLERLYQARDFSEIYRIAASVSNELGKAHQQFLALVESGKPADAAGAIKDRAILENASSDLALTVACGLQGDDAGMRTWLDSARKRFENGFSHKDKTVAAMLASSSPPELKQVDDVCLDLQEKRLLLVTLAGLHPSHRGQYLDRADKMRGICRFPYHLLDRATAALRKK